MKHSFKLNDVIVSNSGSLVLGSNSLCMCKQAKRWWSCGLGLASGLESELNCLDLGLSLGLKLSQQK